jgi:hypothetical protein
VPALLCHCKEPAGWVHCHCTYAAPIQAWEVRLGLHSGKQKGSSCVGLIMVVTPQECHKLYILSYKGQQEPSPAHVHDRLAVIDVVKHLLPSL